MGWFGGSSDDKPRGETTFNSTDDSSFSGGGGGFQSSGITGGGDLRARAQQLQQAAVTNQVIQMYAGMAFEKCVNKPDSSLSSSEVACIEGVVGKFQDFQVFVLERMKRKAGGAGV